MTPPTAQPAPRTLAYTVEIPEDYFPLTEGAFWVYAGTVKWEIGGEVMEKTPAWKMEVIEKVEYGHVTGYAMRGHPSDLAWYEDGKERSDYAIIQVGPNRFYETDIEKLQRLRDKTDSLQDLVHDSQLFLDSPLFPGKRFCEARQIARFNGYCWIVSQVKEVTLGDIEGIPSPITVPEYTLRYMGLPGHVFFQFAPSIGITQYVYGHHGTVSDVDVRLIEYYPGDFANKDD